MKLSTLFASFHVYLLKESSLQVQDKTYINLVTNIPQLIEYCNFCKVISTPIKCIFEKLLSLGLLLLSENKLS